jgi:tetratricopeptide (TPR) repeat protein
MIYKNTFEKLFLILIFNFLFLNLNWGQDLSEVASSYNDVIKVVKDDPASAKNKLEELLPQAEALGEEGIEIKGKIEDLLPSLQYKTALAAYKAKDLPKAISGFEEAMELAKKYDDSKTMKKIKPKLPAVYYSQGRNVLKAGNVQEADALFDKALALNDKYAKAYYGKSMVLRSDDSAPMFEQLDKAIELAGAESKSAKYFKKGARSFLYKEAKAAVKAKKYQQALDDLQKAIGYDFEGSKDSDRIYVKIGKAYAGLNKKSDACAAYKKVTGAKYKKVADYEMQYTLKCY